MRRVFVSLASVALAAIFTLGTAAQAAPVTWTGNADNTWDNSANWSTGAMPQSTDTAVFDGAENNLGVGISLDGADRSVLGLQEISPSTGVTINAGNTLNLGTSGIDMSSAAQNMTINCNVGLTGPQNWTVNSGQTLTVGGAVSNGGSLLTLAGGGNTTISSGLSGNGGLTNNASGTTTLSGALTYTGTTTVSQGVLLVSNPSVFQSSALSIASGGTLQVDTPSYGAAYVMSSISGGGTYLKTGVGQWDMLLPPSGNPPAYISMSQGALIDVEQGELRLGWGPIQNWTANQASLNVASGANFNIWDCPAVYVDALTGAGQVYTQQSGKTPTLYLGVANGSGTFSGEIDAWGTTTINLTKNGSGTQTMTGPLYNLGTTTVNQGVLVISASVFSSPNLSIASGGTLQVDSTNSQGGGNGAISSISGGGVYKKVGPGLWDLMWPGQGVSTTYMEMSQGALIDVEQGTLRLGWGPIQNWTNNQASLNVASGAVFDMSDCSTVYVDAITGAGVITGNNNLAHTLYFGVANGSGTFSGTVQNPISLVKNGSGTQTLSGPLTYSGSTTVNGGTLVVGGNGNMPTSAVSIASGAMMQIAYDGGQAAFNGALLVTGGGTLQKTGAGNWILGADNGAANAISMGSGGLIDVEAGTLTTYWSNDINWTNNLAGLNIAGGATFNMNDGNNVMYVDALTGAGLLQSTGTLHLGMNSGSGTFSGVISGYGLLVKQGTGTQTFSGPNTYTNVTTIENGTLMVGANAPSGSPGALGNTTLAIALGDAVSISSNLGPSLLTGGAFTVGRNITVGASNAATSGVYTIGGATPNSSTFSGLITLNQGLTVSQVSGGTTNLTGNIASGAAGTQTLTFNNTGPVFQSGGNIGGGTGIIAVAQSGSGTTTLSGGLSYTGPTNVNNGTLVINENNNNASIQSSALTVATGTTLQIAYDGSQTIGFEAKSISGAGTIQKTGAGNWVLTDNGGGGTISMGSGGLIDVEAGTLTTYWSTSQNWTNNLAGLNIAGGATFNMNDGGNVMYVDALTGAGSLLNSGTLNLGMNDGSGTFSGVINPHAGQPGSLVKYGTGTETLSGSLYYTGATTVNQGVLLVSNTAANAFQSSALSIASGGTLQVDTPSYGAAYALNSISGGGVYLETGAGQWDMMLPPGGATATYMSMSQGALIDVEQGELRLGWGVIQNWTNNQAALKVAGGASFDLWDSTTVYVDALTGAGTILEDFGHSPTLVVGVAGGSGTFSGVIENPNGTVSLTKSGSGTETLSGNNTYTGLTSINGGVLSLGSQGAIGTGNITFGGGTMQFTAGNTADYSARIKSSTAAVSIDTNGQLVTFHNAIDSSNTDGLYVTDSTGGGTLILNGPDAYLGDTKVDNNGTLEVMASDAIPYGSGLTVGPTGTVEFGNPLTAVGTMAATSFHAAVPAGSVATVPEPGTLALLGVAGILAAAAAWRRRKEI